MKKYLGIFFVFILLGAGCSQNFAKENQTNSKVLPQAEEATPKQEMKFPEDILWTSYYLGFTPTSTVIQNNQGTATEIPGLHFNIEDVYDVFIYGWSEPFVYIGVKLAPTVGYNRGLIDLYQIDLKTKKFISLRRANAYIADVSLDNTKVAYTVYEPTYELIIKNIQDNSEKRLAVSNRSTDGFLSHKSPWKFGDVYFSPDSKKLAYGVLMFQSAAINDAVIYGVGGSVRIVDLTREKLDKDAITDDVSGVKSDSVFRIFGWKNNKDLNFVGLNIKISEFTGKQGEIVPVQFEGCIEE